MDQTKKEVTTWFNSTAVSVERYFLFSSLVLIVLFAWMEPAGAAGIGFWNGLVFWTIQIAILIPLLITIQHVASHFVRLKTPYAPWLQTILAGLGAALLFVPFAHMLDALFAFPDDESSAGIVWDLIDEAKGVVVPVTITWMALNAPWIFQLDFSRKQSGNATEPQTKDEGITSVRPEQLTQTLLQTRFLQELRSRASGELISLSSELHYLRVITTDTEVMFLYNLKDAIDELPSDSGVQIHRSHWVSRDHVQEVRKKNGAFECILSNGRKLPVSRRKYSEVRDMLMNSSSVFPAASSSPPRSPGRAETEMT